MKKLYKAGRWLKRSLPTILAIGAGVGVIFTAISSGKAAIKAEQLRAEAVEVKGCELTRKETIIAQVPAYILPIVSTSLTLACIFGCNWLNRKQQASLAAAAVGIQKSFALYKNKIIEKYGAEVDAAVKEALAEESAQNGNLPTPTEGNVLVHDIITDQWRCMSRQSIIECEYDFNQRFTYYGLVSVAEYCDIFGFDVEDGYDSVGWNVEWMLEGGEMGWLEFCNRERETEAGTPYISIEPVYQPMVNHEDYDYTKDPVFWYKCVQIEPYKERSIA